MCITIWISLDRNLRPHIGALPSLKKIDQRRKICWMALAVPVKRPVGGADVTLAVYALVRLLFSFKRLRSTYLGREKLQQQQHQYPASFFFLTFFVLVTVVGNTLREELPRVKDSLGFWIPRPGFQMSQEKISRILESRFPRHGTRRGGACSRALVLPFSTISGSA